MSEDNPASGKVNISDVSGGEIEVGNIVTGQVEGDVVGGDKIVRETHYHYVDQPATEVPYLVPNLPPHHVPRQAELAILRDLLLGQQRDVAVTALRGMGGVGKTTLAIALCHDKQLVDAFPDGILWATLGPDADLLSAQASWGVALGQDLTSLPNEDSRASRLRSLLHDKRCLLIIDDVWDASHLPLMQVGGPNCATLITTRERKIAQKVGVAHDLDVLKPAQAIALLEQWAGEIAEDEKAVAGELAKRLGYLPLALALAGAQTQDGETFDGLLAVFRDVQGADVTLLDLDDPTMRDESLVLAFDLSLKRLSGTIPEHFAQLGVFAAGREAPFSAEAAAAVWGMGVVKTNKLLGRLVRAALLNKEQDSYSLHLLLGDYARSHLDKETKQAAEARHLTYYLQIAQWSGKDWKATETALPQMRLAWSRIAKDDTDNLYAWAAATHWFCKKRGRSADRVRWVEAALVATVKKGQRRRETWCRYSLGDAYLYGTRNLDEALKQGQISLAIARELGTQFLECQALNLIGRIHGRLGNLEEKLKAHKAALAIAREAGLRKNEPWELNNIGVVYLERGDLTEALKYYQASLAIMREENLQRGIAKLLNNIADIQLQRDELTEALANYQESLSIQMHVGDRGDELRSLNKIGYIYTEQGKLDEALKFYERGLNVCHEAGNRFGEARILHGIGRLYRQRTEFERALTYFQTSLTIERQEEDKVGMAFTLWNMGLVYDQMGQPAEAEKLLVDARDLFQTLKLPQADEVHKDLQELRRRLSE